MERPLISSCSQGKCKHTHGTQKKWPGCEKCEYDTTLLPLLHDKRRSTGWRLMKQHASEPLLEAKSRLRSVRGYFLNVSEWGKLKPSIQWRLWKQRNADIMLWAVALQFKFLPMYEESDSPAALFTLTVWCLQTSQRLCLRVCVFGKWSDTASVNMFSLDTAAGCVMRDNDG